MDLLDYARPSAPTLAFQLSLPMAISPPALALSPDPSLPARRSCPTVARVRLATPSPRVMDWPYVWAVPSESRPGEEHQVDLSH